MLQCMVAQVVERKYAKLLLQAKAEAVENLRSDVFTTSTVEIQKGTGMDRNQSVKTMSGTVAKKKPLDIVSDCSIDF